uniref:UvrD-like helicase C-terminal domain-containing protein n=1 Tax=Anopheles maculatus TaxID=74869 RepID=A0A182TBR5_9DIPT
EVANRFIQQNPHQLKKPLNSLTQGNKKSVVILPQEQLEALLDKVSGYAKPDERILVLARYHHLKPDVLLKAATRWPKLNIEFMTIHASKGQQAEYVIIAGVHDGHDGFPAMARESLIEEVLLPQPEDFPDAEERRLLYVALTRAKHQVWLLQDREHPSQCFYIGIVRYGVEWIPEKDQHIDFAFGNQCAHLLVAPHGAAQHALNRDAAGTLDQVAGGAGSIKLMLCEYGLVIYNPLQQGLFTMIVGNQRDMFTCGDGPGG